MWRKGLHGIRMTAFLLQILLQQNLPTGHCGDFHLVLTPCKMGIGNVLRHEKAVCRETNQGHAPTKNPNTQLLSLKPRRRKANGERGLTSGTLSKKGEPGTEEKNLRNGWGVWVVHRNSQKPHWEGNTARGSPGGTVPMWGPAEVTC